MTKEGSWRGRVGTEKVLGKRKEVEEDDEVVVVGVKRRRMESDSEWRREVELKLFDTVGPMGPDFHPFNL